MGGGRWSARGLLVIRRAAVEIDRRGRLEKRWKKAHDYSKGCGVKGQ
jgi:hypothetical protein